MKNITLITGGVRSGKSALAEKFAASHRRVLYIATCENRDDEMAERIRLHQEQRPGNFGTVEAPLDLSGTVRELDSEACLLIDCLGLWVTNHLLADEARHLANPTRFIGEMWGQTQALLQSLVARQAPPFWSLTKWALAWFRPINWDASFLTVSAL